MTATATTVRATAKPTLEGATADDQNSPAYPFLEAPPLLPSAKTIHLPPRISGNKTTATKVTVDATERVAAATLAVVVNRRGRNIIPKLGIRFVQDY